MHNNHIHHNIIPTALISTRFPLPTFAGAEMRPAEVEDTIYCIVPVFPDTQARGIYTYMVGALAAFYIERLSENAESISDMCFGRDQLVC